MPERAISVQAGDGRHGGVWKGLPRLTRREDGTPSALLLDVVGLVPTHVGSCSSETSLCPGMNRLLVLLVPVSWLACASRPDRQGNKHMCLPCGLPCGVVFISTCINPSHSIVLG